MRDGDCVAAGLFCGRRGTPFNFRDNTEKRTPTAMVLTNVFNKRIFMSVKSLSRVVRVEPNEKRGVNREEDIL